MTAAQHRRTCAVLLLAAILCGTVQIKSHISKPIIGQRYVQIIEIGPDHPPKEYVIAEPDR
jgi:hypothetical protein